MPSARIRAAVLGLAVPAVLALTAAPAAAHNELLSSTPKSGSSVTALPQAVELKFAEEADARFVKIATTGPDGSSVAMGTPDRHRHRGAAADQAGHGQRHVHGGVPRGLEGRPPRVRENRVHGNARRVQLATSPSPSTAPVEVPAERCEPKKAAATKDSGGNGWMLYAAIGVGVLLLGGLALMLRARASRTG